MTRPGTHRRSTQPATWLIGAALLGVLHAASFFPLNHWLVHLVSLSGLLALLLRSRAHERTTQQLTLITGLFALHWFGTGLAWLFVSMHHYGGLSAPLAITAVLLFAAYLAAFPCLAVWLTQRLLPGAGALTWIMGLTATWTLAEWARGTLFTGFPWLAIAYAQIDSPLAALAPVLGVHGVGAATLIVAGALATLVPSHARTSATAVRGIPLEAPRRIGMALITISLVLGSASLVPTGHWTHPVGPPLSVRLVQGNVPQHMKFEPQDALAAMRAYTVQFESSQAQLTILPETAWTIPWAHTPIDLQTRIDQHIQRGHALALGMPWWQSKPTTGQAQLTNSVLLRTPKSRQLPLELIPRYDKHHLVPFGEFIPAGFAWFVAQMKIPLGNFDRGHPHQPPLSVDGQTIGFNICYEDLFGEELRHALLGTPSASILANVSNIAWFGQTHALPQHLAIARMRSRELGRPMLRATNTGITALIDAQGQVVAQLPAHTHGALDVVVQGTAGLTPYARLGNMPVLVLAGLLTFAVWAYHARSQRHGATKR